MSRLLAIGGAHIDRRGQVFAPFVPGASNPGRMREEVGGGAFNALRIAARLGLSGSLLSVRGGDASADAVAAAIAAERIADLSAVFLDRATPSYTAILDHSGDVVAALADMELYEIAFARLLRRSAVRQAVEAADAVLVDANLPAPALEQVLRHADGRAVFAIAISPAKAVRLAEALPRLAALFMNGREAAALAGLPAGSPAETLVAALQARGLAAGAVTAGSDPVIGFDADGVFSLQPPAAERIADVTGAGDALAGATVAAVARGASFREALRDGVAAAFLTIQCAAAAAPLSPELLAEARRLVDAPAPWRPGVSR